MGTYRSNSSGPEPETAGCAMLAVIIIAAFLAFMAWFGTEINVFD